MFRYMGQHPHLIPSHKKEIHFFDGGLNPEVDTYKKGETWYRSHFPLKQEGGNAQKAFEASPLYIFNPLTPQRIAGLIPEVRIIVVLRNPVMRAISHYFQEKRKGRETLPLMKALHAEEKRLKPLVAKQDYKNEIYIHHSYKSRGLYYKQIERYLDYFSMRNILVINSEKLFTQPAPTLRRAFDFVGVDPDFTVKDLRSFNIGRNKTDVDPAVYEYLEDYFRLHNQDLYGLVDENYGW